MTAALIFFYAAAAALGAAVVAGAVAQLRRGVTTYGLVFALWAGSLLAADVTYVTFAHVADNNKLARRLVLVLVAILLISQVLLARRFHERWAELTLDAVMVASGSVLTAWTLAIVVIDTDASLGTSAYIVYVFSAALLVSALHGQLRTLMLPRRLDGRLVLGFAAMRCAGIGYLVLKQMRADVPAAIGVLAIALSYLLMLAVIARTVGFVPDRARPQRSRFESSVPHLVVVVTAPVALVGLAVEPGLRRPPFIAMYALLAVALCIRQILMSNANDKLLRRIVEREQMFKSLVQDSSDITMIATADGQLEYVSPATERVLGRPAASLAHDSAAAVLGVDAEVLAAATRAVLATGQPERLESRPTSEPTTVLESLLSKRGDRVLINVRNVSEQAEMRAQLQTMAYTDVLTGLPNWHRMHEEITAALAAAGPPGSMAEPALLFVDLDRFKSVNDAAGHAAGDAVLRVVADRLQAVVPAGAMLARVGGDEFLVLLPAGAAGRRELVAHDIARVMAEPCETDHGSFAIGASVGIAPASGARDADDLLRHADLAMYAAKRDLRPWQAYEPRLHAAAVERAERDRAYSAILDGHQLAVVFQPVVELATGAPIACEALLRWRGVDGRLGEPTGLLEFAARSGRMYDLSIWVLRTALDEAVRWRDAGASVPVAVNLSSRDVLHPGLANLIRAELRSRDLAPAALSLEITEQVLLDDPAAAMAVCEELRALGVIVAIDDFGTGFSSLAYLIDLPIDALKIDQSFIHSLTRGASAGVIVRAIVHMATELGLHVVAEGIETAEHRDLTVAAGVKYGQGYLYAGELDGALMGELIASSSAPAMARAGAPSNGVPGGTAEGTEPSS